MAEAQTTLGGMATVTGIGVHSGAPATLTLMPAPAGTGIKFRRTGLEGAGSRTIPAHVDFLGPTELCTVLGDAERGSVSTVEHLLAALRGLGVDNAICGLDGPEMPIMDGSSADFVEAIDAVGIVSLNASRRFIRVLKPVRVEHGRAFAELLPHRGGFRLEVEIDFPTPLIGRQSLSLDLTPKAFRSKLCRARTFGFLKDVEKLLPMGFARGSSLENTVVLDETRILNPEGLRAPDEFVRHKTLDAVGDLALAGLPIEGLYRSYCGGHRLNTSIVKALLADPTAFAIVESAPATKARVGAGELPLPQPAFGPGVR